MGTLAGSTISLLTWPWMLCTFQGAVDIDSNGKPSYKKNPKLTNKLTDFSRIGTVPTDEIAINAKLMMISSVRVLFLKSFTLFFKK